MTETVTLSSGSATLPDLQPGPSHPEPTPSIRAHHFRSRIGVDPAGGFYPAPHRYQVYLAPGCPDSLRVSITLELLGLRDWVTTTHLAHPTPAPDALASLRGAYEATRHHYSGPLAVPALCDRWSGRVVSNHAHDILRDLAGYFGDQCRPDRLRLRPAGLVADIDAIRELLDEDITRAAQRAGAAPASQRHGEALDTLLAALDLLDRQLACRPYLLGDELTAADVDLWVTLVHLDVVHRVHLDADAVHAVSRHDRLWDYVRRLHGHPAFRDTFQADQMTQLHRRTCRGPESSGAAVTLPGVLRAGG
ncbi:MAG: hypothetical protein QOF84_1371 [Streptomyces sp.]|jgi:putative glutathione S-transferase|nr:hypothetical protein [Streptomyces sp.]